MPKFLGGKIVVTTFETFANTEQEAEDFVLKWQEADDEVPEPGIKVTKHKFSWNEFDMRDPTPVRDRVLQAFLELMQQKIPGMPKLEEKAPEESKIIVLNRAQNRNECPNCGSIFHPSAMILTGDTCPNCRKPL